MGAMLDTSANYLSWINTISVEYLSKTSEQVPNSGPIIPYVLRTYINKSRLKADSILAKYEITFRFAAAVLGGIVPKVDDIIVDDSILVNGIGLRWKVEMVDVVSFRNEFRCHCNKSQKQNVTVGGPGIAT